MGTRGFYQCYRTAGSRWALRDGTIDLWDETASTMITTFEGHSRYVAALCLVEDGRLAAASSGRISLLNVETRAETARLDGNSSFRLCLLQDGRLASASSDTIQLWDVANGFETARLAGHTDWVSDLCQLEDGRLATASADGTIWLWDTHSSDTRDFAEPTPSVTALCLMPGGKLASAGFWDKAIRLWDVATRTEVPLLAEQKSWVNALCPLPDGRLACGLNNNTIELCDTATDWRRPHRTDQSSYGTS